MESHPSKLNADTQPYAVEREIEDIEALIEASGGSASLYGFPPARLWPWKQPLGWEAGSIS